MRNKVKILINGEEFSLREGSELLEIPYAVFVNKTIIAKSFEYKGYKVERLSPVNAAKGTILKCLETGKTWRSLRAFFLEAGIKKPWCYNVSIRKYQRFRYKGNTYVAINYRGTKHTLHTGKHAKYDIQNAKDVNTVIVKEPELPLKEPVKQTVSVKEQAIVAVRNLAIERIKQAKYDLATNVLQALELLSK